jgi:hypothetical protein
MTPDDLQGITMKPCLDHGHTKGLATEGYKRIFAKSHAGHSRLHRKVYAQVNGLSATDIKGLVIRHACDNPRCIEPDHLVIGTFADNNWDRSERGRSAKVLPSARRLTDADAARIRAICQPRHKEFSVAALARFYKVDAAAIWKIYKGITYFQEVTP